MASTIDDSVIMSDGIINTADSASTNVPTNVMSTVLANVMSTASINSDYKNVRYEIDCYYYLLFIIPIICYHYAKHRSKQKILVY